MTMDNSNWIDEIQIPQKIVKENIVKIELPTFDNPVPETRVDINLNQKPIEKTWQDGKKSFYFTLSSGKLLQLSQAGFNEVMKVIQEKRTGKIVVNCKKNGKYFLYSAKPI